MEIDLRYIDYPIKINNLTLLKNRLLISKTPIKYSSKKKVDNLYNQTISNTNKTNNTETVDSSSRLNPKNILSNENLQIIPYKKKNLKYISKTNQKKVRKDDYSKLRIGKMECQIPKYCESIKSCKNSDSRESKTIFSKKEFINDNNSMKYNNISFKEIKCKAKTDIIDKSNLLHNISYKNIKTNKNKEFLKRFKLSILESLKTDILKGEKNIFNKKIKTKRNEDNFLNDKSKEINKTAEKIANKIKINSIKSKYLHQFKIGKDNNNNTRGRNSNSLIKYDFTKCKIQKINTKLKIKNLETLKLKISKNKSNNNKYIQNIRKIQSIWRGIHFRKFIKIGKFIKIINSVINKKYKKIFTLLLEYKIESEKNKIYNDYLTHFNLNLNIMNNAQVIIKQCPSFKEKQTKKYYKISKNNLSLIKNKCILKEICHNVSINIVKNKEIVLKEESQKNLNTIIEGVKPKKLFSNCVIEDQKDNKINIIIQNKNNYENNKESKLNNSNKHILLEESIDKRKESFELDNQITLFSEIKDENIIEHQRLCFISNNKINASNNSLNLIVVKNENLIFKNKEKINLKQSNINNFNILKTIKQYCEKTTETTSELEELNNTDYNIIKSKKYIKNYNTNNEIDNKSALEINPFEIKRENKIEYINRKMKKKEKAKINLKKIIFPIKIKTNIIECNKRYIFFILINNLKNKAFTFHLSNINISIINKSKKYFFQRIKNISSSYYKNYYLNQASIIKLLKLFNEYLFYIKNKALIEVTKFLISIK